MIGSFILLRRSARASLLVTRNSPGLREHIVFSPAALPPGLCAIGCPIVKIGDGVCDPDCRDAVECRHDEYDCLRSFLGATQVPEPPAVPGKNQTPASPNSEFEASSGSQIEMAIFISLGLAALAFAVGAITLVIVLRKRRKDNASANTEVTTCIPLALEPVSSLIAGTS
jgi:hypothetical protein